MAEKQTYRILHVGIPCEDREEEIRIARRFQEAFGFEYTEAPASVFTSGKQIEILSQRSFGTRGHLAVGTDDLEASIRELEAKGFSMRPDSEIVRNGKVLGVYLQEEFGGFAVHLLQLPKKEEN